jgi:hypothetical protein
MTDRLTLTRAFEGAGLKVNSCRSGLFDCHVLLGRDVVVDRVVDLGRDPLGVVALHTEDGGSNPTMLKGRLAVAEAAGLSRDQRTFWPPFFLAAGGLRDRTYDSVL